VSHEQEYLCRCECVTTGEVRGAIAEGNLTINDVKRRCRAGMGICQGIFCVDQIARLLVENGIDPETIEAMTARPPTRLIPLVVAADAEATGD
jgi:NAD(P)H-nitrite reductase large subunit